MNECGDTTHAPCCVRGKRKGSLPRSSVLQDAIFLIAHGTAENSACVGKLRARLGAVMHLPLLPRFHASSWLQIFTHPKAEWLYNLICRA